MVGGDKIDIMDMILPDHIHDRPKEAGPIHPRTQPPPGDLNILAIGAFKRTAGKKNRARPPFAGDGGLLPEMGPDIGDPQFMALPAKTFAAGLALLQSIHAAVPGAHSAVLKQCQQIHVMHLIIFS